MPSDLSPIKNSLVFHGKDLAQGMELCSFSVLVYLRFGLPWKRSCSRNANIWRYLRFGLSKLSRPRHALSKLYFLSLAWSVLIWSFMELVFPRLGLFLELIFPRLNISKTWLFLEIVFP